MDHAECEKALLPTLEHASLVHSHLHHPMGGSAADGGGSALTGGSSHDTFDQTRNAIVYISVNMIN